ncbi:hypothetical protein KP509_28G032000 [Ceratopteris richardii]|uniref:Nas2 N-terminal domain-containing protein n=1 Tax=Ceratopteris richardii TaxID=49495 RepID=A0A8T2RCN3_CERRI|nr:hypothetical protein KP509_28G032000 [Ceratopteris richardii]
MVGTNLKAETFALMDKRSELETEMNVIISRLCRPGGPGLEGNLLDREGFPRADIDIFQVRGDRQRLSVLRNDHKSLTEQIEKNIGILHSTHTVLTLPQKRTAEGEEVHPRSIPTTDSESSRLTSQTPPIVPSSRTAEMHPPAGLPFAVFDEVQEGSPAKLDGIMIGDQLIKFGSVEGGDNVLIRLAAEGHMNEGKAVPVIVLRRGVQVQLTVTPRPWSGPGLLGCHVQQI